MSYDFGGYATKHNIRCSDGRTIMPNAFKDCDGQIVPLVWQHIHESPDNVLGHAQLENRSDGVYAYCSLNETQAGKNARELVKHGDICALSIYANKLRQEGQNVMHGVIREVSLVLAGANPGATIDNLSFAHSDGSYDISEDEAYMSFVEAGKVILMHADEEKPEDEKSEEVQSDKTIEEIIETMNAEQKAALYAIVGALTEEQEEDEKPKGKSEEKPEEEVEEEPESLTFMLMYHTLQLIVIINVIPFIRRQKFLSKQVIPLSTLRTFASAHILIKKFNTLTTMTGSIWSVFNCIAI